MPLSHFTNVALSAVAAVVPGQTHSVLDELRYYDGDRERALRFSETSGLRERRVAPEGVTASDLCIQAARFLLDATGTDGSEIGAVLFVSQASDYLLPATAAHQQHILGLSGECAALDITVGCAGFVKGFWTGAGLIASGACSKVLLLVGDTPARFLDPANRVVGPAFGDAGTAALLEYREGAPSMSFLLGCNGARQEALLIPGGGARIPSRPGDTPESPFHQTVADTKGNPWSLGGYGRIYMDGMAVYSFGVSVIPPHIKRHLALAGRNAADLDHLLLHQTNKVMLEAIIRKVDVAPERAPFTALSKYGNLGAASIPALICDHFAPAGAGSEGRGSAATMLCGFGAGLSWGSCLLSLAETRVFGVRDFVPPPHIPTREERIAYWHEKFQKGT